MRTRLYSAAFAIFVVASTLGLSIQQREREIALLRAVAATPGQIPSRSTNQDLRLASGPRLRVRALFRN